MNNVPLFQNKNVDCFLHYVNSASEGERNSCSIRIKLIVYKHLLLFSMPSVNVLLMSIYRRRHGDFIDTGLR